MVVRFEQVLFGTSLTLLSSPVCVFYPILGLGGSSLNSTPAPKPGLFHRGNSMTRSLQSVQKSFALLLGGKPLNNAGARETLAMRRQERAVPFIPICAFGFVLDESGPERMSAPIEWTGADAKRGGA